MDEMRRAVLDACAGGPVTAEAVADALGLSQASVCAHVEALRRDGFDVVEVENGYELAGVSGYTGPAIEYGLEAPFSIEHHDRLASTNVRGRKLATDGATDVVVVADEQTGGTGRLDRSWDSPPGGVWLSIVCRPAIESAQVAQYTLAAAVATTETAREAGVDARIKWPNDVVVPADTDRGYRKLAGILTEMEADGESVSWLVCGIGVNANVDGDCLPAGATSLREQREDVDRRLFVGRLLERFDAYRSALETVVPAWRERAMTLGQQVRVDRDGGAVVGRAVDVTDHGALQVETDDGLVTVTAGDCEHLRPL